MPTDGKAATRMGTQDEQATQLLRDVARGDRVAMNRLYALYEGPVYRFAMARLDDPSAAADVLNQTMLDAWREAGRFRGDAKVLTWVLGLAFLRTRDWVRTNLRAPMDEPEPAPEEDSGDLSVVLDRMDDVQYVRQAVKRLSTLQRSALHLAFHEDLSYAEMAAVMGCPEGTAKSGVIHAKQALKQFLAA